MLLNCFLGMLSVKVIIIENGIGDLRSNLGWGCLHFIIEETNFAQSAGAVEYTDCTSAEG